MDTVGGGCTLPFVSALTGSADLDPDPHKEMETAPSGFSLRCFLELFLL